jgi:hypothetical protein
VPRAKNKLLYHRDYALEHYDYLARYTSQATRPTVGNKQHKDIRPVQYQRTHFVERDYTTRPHSLQKLKTRYSSIHIYTIYPAPATFKHTRHLPTKRPVNTTQKTHSIQSFIHPTEQSTERKAHPLYKHTRTTRQKKAIDTATSHGSPPRPKLLETIQLRSTLRRRSTSNEKVSLRSSSTSLLATIPPILPLFLTLPHLLPLPNPS